jgi:hypothetical protein
MMVKDDRLLSAGEPNFGGVDLVTVSSAAPRREPMSWLRS